MWCIQKITVLCDRRLNHATFFPVKMNQWKELIGTANYVSVIIFMCQKNIIYFLYKLMNKVYFQINSLKIRYD